MFTQKNYIGWGALENLIPEIKNYQPKNILIVTDPILLEIGVVKQVTDLLEKETYNFSIYAEIEPEPSLKTGENLVEYAKVEAFDFVIGLGGGSALDLAKLAAVLAVHDGRVADYLNLSGTKILERKGLPKILIPSTSGTGSEVTNISVLSLETTKDVVTHDFLLADAAIIDPKLTVTVPEKVTAATGVDALTHAIEAYLSPEASAVTDGLALHAIRLIQQSLKSAVEDGENEQARTAMSNGSYMAGLAFFNAGVGAVHALAYPLGGQFNISHGESNAVLLPYVMHYVRKSCVERMKDIYEALGEDVREITAEEASKRCVGKLEEIVSGVGIPTRLSDFGIPENALAVLSKDAVKQKRLLARSPRLLDESDIQKIYESAYSGRT